VCGFAERINPPTLVDWVASSEEYVEVYEMKKESSNLLRQNSLHMPKEKLHWEGKTPETWE